MKSFKNIGAVPSALKMFLRTLSDGWKPSAIRRHASFSAFSTILGIVCLLLTGCYEESIESLSMVDEATPHTAYIALNLAMPSSTSTRSTNNPPKGGEWGDGRERGQYYENTVTSAAVFLYQDEKGVNGDANTPVTMVSFNTVYGNQNSTDNIDYIATTEPQTVGLENGHYNVIAIANPNDLSWAQGGGLTLGTVRDHIQTTAWTETEGSYSSFFMSSENEGAGIEITEENNTEDNPAIATADVERMAARVDYQATGTFTINEDEYGNVTGDGDSNYTGATVTITGAAIVNNLTAGSYLLKRVNSGLGTSVTYLGDETADANDMATNYVIDPWTDEKDGASEEVTIDGVKSPISSLYGVYYPGIATGDDEQNPSYWEDLITAGTPVTDSSDNTTWNRIGYTMENTTYDTYTNKKYNTGAVFAATFTPATGTVRDSFYANEDFSYDYTNHATFFKWNEVLYATAEDMMAVAYPSTSTPAFTADDMFGTTTFESISTIDDLKAFAETLRDDDPTGYKAYLESIVEGGVFPATSISDLYWETYMENVCGYKFDTTDLKVIINNFDVETTYTSTRAALSAATDEGVSTYENAQCYYTWWIRHSNDATDDYDGNATNGIMEYAIVRNNIYKLQVTSVYSIGGDIPREGLRIHVYVKNWTMYGTETIDL